MANIDAGNLKVEISPYTLREALSDLAADVTHFREALDILNDWMTEKAGVYMVWHARERQWRVHYAPDVKDGQYDADVHSTFSLALKAALERVDGA